jgi:hypothetical protein
VNKINPTKISDLADVKDAVIKDWSSDQRRKKAQDLAKDIEQQLKDGKALSALTGTGFTKSVSQAVSYDKTDTGKDGVPREALAPLFDLDKNGVATVPVGNDVMVIRVKDILDGQADKAAQEKIQDAVKNEWGTRHIDEFTRALQTLYPVEIDKAGFQNLVKGE